MTAFLSKQVKTCFLLLSISLATACQILEPLERFADPKEPEKDDSPPVVEIDQVILWLQTAYAASTVSPEQALERLKQIGPRPTGEFDRFRYALLNQQLGDRTGWIRARDTLRELVNENTLSPDLVHLAKLMQQHNQDMINAESRQHQMAQELDAAQIAQQDLQKKIKALTSLEKNISIRKELAVEEATGPAE